MDCSYRVQVCRHDSVTSLSPPGLTALLSEVTVEQTVAHLRVLPLDLSLQFRKTISYRHHQRQIIQFCITKDSSLYLDVDPLCCT